MKRFKRRTLALILASAVTVAGSFAASNYKNSLMELNFETSPSGINMILQTKTQYNGNVTPLRKDANTFVLILPETDTNAPSPNVAEIPNIENVSISKYPYTQNSKGYLKILIKTNAPVNIQGQNKIYIPSTNVPKIEQNDAVKNDVNISNEADAERQISKSKDVLKNNENSINTIAQSQKAVNKEPVPDIQEDKAQVQSTENIEPVQEESNVENDSNTNNITKKTSENDTYSYILSALAAILVVLAIVFFIARGKEKLSLLNIDNIDVSDDDDTKHNKKNGIRANINKLDKMYSKTSMPGLGNYSYTNDIPQEAYNNTEVPIEKNVDNVIETENVLDLDEILKEQNAERNNISEENTALDEFLSDFSFDTEYEILSDTEEEKEEEKYIVDEKLFNGIINGSYTFSKDDLKKINELMQGEISDEAREYLVENTVSMPIKPIKPDADKLVENFMLDYAINQNIRFNGDDANVLRKLVSVELDESFIKDLKIDKEKVKKSIDEIRSRDKFLKQHKNESPKILKVKDELPDLSKELKNYNGNVQSDFKPRGENYDLECQVNILKIDFDLLGDSDNSTNKSINTNRNKQNDSDILLDKLSEETNIQQKPQSAEISKQVRKPETKPIQKQVLKTESQSAEISKQVRKPETKPIQKQVLKTEEKIVPKQQIPAKKETVKQNDVCIVDNVMYSIIDNALISNDSGYYLADYNNQYYILGYVGKKIFKLKTYENLKVKNIQCRLYKKISDAKEQYLVKIGLNKVLICKDNDSMEFIMDL